MLQAVLPLRKLHPGKALRRLGIALVVVGVGVSGGRASARATTSSAVEPATAGASAATTRVVSLVPNLTEIAFAVGAGDQVVGVSDFCLFPPEARQRPSVGGLINPNLEAVLRLQPDVVFLYRSQRDFAARLSQLGVRSQLLQTDTLADFYNAVEIIGKETGETTRAERLITGVRAGLDRLRQGKPSDQRPKGIVIVSRDRATLRSMYQASSGTFLGELFVIAGGRLAVPEGAPISMEAIIRANPDIIIDFSTAGSDDATTTTAINPEPFPAPSPWALLTTVRAVQTGAVYRWTDPHALLLGPGVVDTAKKMQQILPEN